MIIAKANAKDNPGEFICLSITKANAEQTKKNHQIPICNHFCVDGTFTLIIRYITLCLHYFYAKSRELGVGAAKTTPHALVHVTLWERNAFNISQLIRSEKLQNESFPNFWNFRPGFCPEFCSEFSPNFSRTFRASFRGRRRPEKIHQKSPPFFNAKSPGKHEKIIHKILLESRQSNN